MFALRTCCSRIAILAAALMVLAPVASRRASAQRPSPVAAHASLAAADSALHTAAPQALRSQPLLAIVASDSIAVRRRSPIVAGVLGVLPGLGHIYAGEPGRGLAVGGIWLGTGLVMFGGGDRTVRGVAAVVNLATYVFGIADAALAAQRFNARQARTAPGRVAR